MEVSIPRIIKTTIVVLVTLTIGATAFAATDWEGDASGNCSGISPFEPWEGTLDETSFPNDFTGFWGNDASNQEVLGNVDSTISGVKWLSGDWEYGNVNYGAWIGYFDESGDDAGGYWWVYQPDSSSCNGTWWGNLAE